MLLFPPFHACLTVGNNRQILKGIQACYAQVAGWHDVWMDVVTRLVLWVSTTWLPKLSSFGAVDASFCRE